MMRTLIAGNWKLNTLPSTAATLIQEILSALETHRLAEETGLAVCPPFTQLAVVGQAIRNSRIMLGAQHCSEHSSGAYTGEVSAAMLAECGCRYVIVGHSERRTYHNESNELCRARIAAALAAGLTPIYCIGETLAQRDAGKTLEIVERQLREGLAAIEPAVAGALVIAYEPVWAIGTGRAATPEQINEVHTAIRHSLSARYPAFGRQILLLYGGSMKPQNAAEILALPEVNGGLIGGASLQAEQFLSIAAAAH